MKKIYKNRLPKGKEVKNTNVRVENGELIVEVEFKEKFKPKDGDFVVTNNGCIFIYNGNYSGLCKEDFAGFYVGVDSFGDIVINNGGFFSRTERLATEQEKSDFLERLKKEYHKKWNAENKCLEDIRWKPNHGDYYFFVDTDGKIKRTKNVAYWDVMRVNINNCFPTEEAAQPYADQIINIFKN